MQREWKTWPQIAIMVLQQIKNFPCGHNLLWIEFKDIDDDNSMASFVMDTEETSDVEDVMLADYVIMILKKLRIKYKISSVSIH